MSFNNPSKKPKLSKLDQLFIDYIECLTKEIDKSYNIYNFHNPAIKLRKFLWDIFASNYIEMIKPRVYNSDKNFNEEEVNSAKYTLHFLLERFLMLIYPIIPQVSTTIADEREVDLIKASYPKAKRGKCDLMLIEKIMEFNKNVWKKKKEAGISLKEKISGIKIPNDFKNFERDLKICHKLA